MSQSSEEIRYVKNQQRPQEARDAANPARKRQRYTSVFVGSSYAMRVKKASAQHKIHHASPIYETTYDHVRPAKSAAESGIGVKAEEVDGWIESMAAEYGELLDGGVDSKENGFLDAGCFSDIAPKGLETKRKLFGAKTEERVAGCGRTDAVVRLKRKAEDIESPFGDKRAYKAVRASIPVRVKDRWRMEADTWLEGRFASTRSARWTFCWLTLAAFPDIPTGVSKIQDSFEQMAISSKDSPPTLSEGSSVTPETEDDEDEGKDDGNEDGGHKSDGDDLLDQLFSLTDKKVSAVEEGGRWLWRSSKHPTLGFVREKVWLRASDWS